MMNDKPTEQLWALHIEGPDDIFAMPSKEAAEQHAAMLNEKFKGTKHGDNYPNINAEVVPWPYTAEGHAEDMKANLKESQ